MMSETGIAEPSGEGLSLEWPGPAETAGTGAAVVTGVFDLLHVGHTRFLAEVRAQGRPLLVGVEDDRRTQAWKGAGRPFQPAQERAEILAALRAVDGVFLIHGDPGVVDWRSYTALLEPLRPAALAYTAADPHGESKRLAAEDLGAQAWEIPLVPGRSTTHIAAALQAAGQKRGG